MFSYQLHTDSLFLCANFNSSPMTYDGAGIWLSLSLQPRCSDTFIYLHQGTAVVLSTPSESFCSQLFQSTVPVPLTCAAAGRLRDLRTLRTVWGVFSLLFNMRMTTSPTNLLALIQPPVPIMETASPLMLPTPSCNYISLLNLIQRPSPSKPFHLSLSGA